MAPLKLGLWSLSVEMRALRVEMIKKDLCKIFNKYGLKITMEANKKIVNFLDVTLNLANGTYLPSPYSRTLA